MTQHFPGTPPESVDTGLLHTLACRMIRSIVRDTADRSIEDRLIDIHTVLDALDLAEDEEPAR